VVDGRGVILMCGCCCTTPKVQRPCRIAAETFDCRSARSFLGRSLEWYKVMMPTYWGVFLEALMIERESENFVFSGGWPHIDLTFF